MVERCKERGALPYVARKQSTDLILNRFWAAIKRERLTILAEDVSILEEIDSLRDQIFVKGNATPCRTMDATLFDFPVTYFQF